MARITLGQLRGVCLGALRRLGALGDPSQNVLTPHAQWVDNTGGGGSQGQASKAPLVPVDGSLLVGVLNNPNNAPLEVSSR